MRRYDIEVDREGRLDIEEWKGGDWCKASDVAKLARRVLGYSPRHSYDCPIDVDGVCLCGWNTLKAELEALAGGE